MSIIEALATKNNENKKEKIKQPVITEVSPSNNNDKFGNDPVPDSGN